MRTDRVLQCFALLCAIALGAAAPSLALPRLALPGGEPAAAAENPAESPIVEFVARKGSRVYSPEAEAADPTAHAAATEETKPAKPDPAAEAKALDDCMRTWDASTHITQSHWKDICKRQINERGAMLDR